MVFKTVNVGAGSGRMETISVAKDERQGILSRNDRMTTTKMEAKMQIVSKNKRSSVQLDYRLCMGKTFQRKNRLGPDGK